jgi:hypothetical protein
MFNGSLMVSATRTSFEETLICEVLKAVKIEVQISARVEGSPLPFSTSSVLVLASQGHFKTGVRNYNFMFKSKDMKMHMLAATF